MDYWWPNVPGLAPDVNHSESYLRPFETVWRVGGDVIVPRQPVGAVFFVFQAPVEEMAQNRVKIPRSARPHLISQGTLDNWEFVLDLGEDEVDEAAPLMLEE
jgi:hypothetical protein